MAPSPPPSYDCTLPITAVSTHTNRENYGGNKQDLINTPFFPASGPATGSSYGLHPESGVLGASQSPERRGRRS